MCKTINPRTVNENQIGGYQKGTREWKEMLVTIGLCSCPERIVWAWIKGNKKQMVVCEVKSNWEDK